MAISALPISVSLCMIVKNEEQNIARCLSSVYPLMSEIIIVDTGSTDKTKEIVSQFTNKIYDFKWIDDFSAARNYAFSLANGDYTFWLDADDVLIPEDYNKFHQILMALNSDVDAVSMLYNLAFDERGNVTCQLRRNRLVKTTKRFRWVGAVHEYLEVYGNVLNSDIAIYHKPHTHDAYRNLCIYEKRLLNGDTFTPRDLYYFANELSDHKLYNRAIEYYEKFLATKQGWVEDNIAACGKLCDCFYAIKDSNNQLKYIFKSFEYDVPRAEFCCRLGYYFLEQNVINQAIFWYRLAIQVGKPPNPWAVTNCACYTWLPHIQLCVCYSRIGEYVLANQHNEAAAVFNPDFPAVDHNRKYLQQFIASDKQSNDRNM
ncbi:nucleotide-diphospho-sugar transferases [Lucifera butyrica]|uniref:Nucleotide-diphospho-sugar transferases n=1 Tax=Lucifera butyrica TaxID=1351585 RepID=A0A498RC80_9FIRM|nr:glycosyltransferase family 2 protein [Lucifera butyrica]VBB07723.1 nucleotide-diphospho-sugar transferases [Lucifera butyrica]